MRIRSYNEIQARGTRLYAFINAVRQSDMICLAQQCSGEEFRCRIRQRDLPTFQQLADRYGMSLESHTIPSLQGKLRRFRLRIGIPLGLLAAILVIFYCSNIVAVIDIQGAETVSEGAILAMLESEGVTRGSWIAGIDFKRCEQMLRMHVPGVAWAGVRHTGNRLVIEISEATPGIDVLQERLPCNIVSLYDAQITDVTVYNGHLERMIGDGVSKGELLVSGVFETPYGDVKYHHAIASIQGIYEKEAELTEYFTVTETEKTGRTLRRNALQIFHFRIPLSLRKPDFAEYTELETEVPFSIFSHTLPFSIVQQTYTETVTTIRQRTEEETRLALNGAIVRYEKNFLHDVEILERQTTFTADENGMTCHVTFRVEGEIGTVSDIFPK